MGQTVIVFQEDCILTAAGREGRREEVSAKAASAIVKVVSFLSVSLALHYSLL